MNRKYRFTKESLKRMTDFLHQDTGKREEKPEVKEVLHCYALTDVGKVRAANQDALVVCDESGLYGVADGMGGHNGGETASAGARDVMVELTKGAEPALDALRSAVKEANASLYRQQAEDEKLSGMGTTLSVVWLSRHFAYLAHVGDSRIYRMRDGELCQMTDDHSLVAELVRRGQLTEEEAEHHPMKNVILRAVGTEPDVDVDLAVEERRAGDLWLICSDGLHGMVSDEKMEAILTENDPEAAAKLLMEAALAAGGRDNISLVVLKDEEAEK